MMRPPTKPTRRRPGRIAGRPATASPSAISLTGHQVVEQDREDRDRRRVVQQAFALDQSRQTRRRAEITKDRDHGGGIGGRDDRGQQQAGDQRHLNQRPKHQANSRGGRQDRDHREDEDRRGVLRQTPDVDRQSRLEQQDRQEDVQEPARRDREVQDQRRDVVERVGEPGVQEKARSDADEHPDDGEQDGV